MIGITADRELDWRLIFAVRFVVLLGYLRLCVIAVPPLQPLNTTSTIQAISSEAILLRLCILSSPLSDLLE
ncbi:hypothetical protein N6H13_01870 [Paenibacillus sp. CC-CFT742]|nr:hypothetical protein [Paenibacillus sp. CC-CFT742]WJH29562.1 hypothetical protein N6H13_01870 [Paenibacillus sp. CC-CFT742]